MKNLKNFTRFLKESEFSSSHRKNVDELLSKINNNVFNGDLDLSSTDISSLPEDLHITGHLDLSYCKNITELPKGLFVGGIIFIKNSSLTLDYVSELQDNGTITLEGISKYWGYYNDDIIDYKDLDEFYQSEDEASSNDNPKYEWEIEDEIRIQQAEDKYDSMKNGDYDY